MILVKQRTIRNEIQAVGVGLHTGKQVHLKLCPAPVNTGIVFKRVDISPAVSIPAKAAYVGDTRLSTTLVLDTVQVATVEHLLSAIAGLGIDNVIVELDAPEVPIMDGSAFPFVFLLESAGIKHQDAPKSFIKIKEEIKVTDQDKWASLQPFEGFKVSFIIEYQHPHLHQNNKTATFDLSSLIYTKEVARARTFGFMDDYEWLKSNNLALGGSLFNAVVLDKDSILNPEGLRDSDELVKHKILDAVGDLYLLGMNIVGAFAGYKSGHYLNNVLLNTLLLNQQAWEVVHYEESTVPISFTTAML
jgi:UDP-3-O-[3-hydroxymyristoyl] N-acetylglucosamine deacetylase